MKVQQLLVAAFLLVFLFCQIEGATKVMSDNSYDTSLSNNNDFNSHSTGLHKRDQDVLPCCSSENVHFHSIADALNNISSNTILNVMADSVLSSFVELVGLRNITVKGHRNPVVKCNDAGAVKFTSCKNVTIEGILWERCGSVDYLGIQFYKSYDVSFQRCSFHNFKGRSVSLSETSGNVYINNCSFTHAEHTGHGAAVHYTSNTIGHSQHNLVIKSSKFIFNRPTQSVVYIDGSGSMIPVYILMQDNMFINNTGISVYISDTNLHIKGVVLFKENRAKYGGAIYSKNSEINFYSKCEFINNSVTNNGGAVYLKNSEMSFGISSKVIFNYNRAEHFGSAIWAYNSKITFDGNSSVKFSNNKARSGGAVNCYNSSHITFDGNSSVTFNNNKASDGAAVCCLHSSLTFDDNSSVAFNNNEAKYGGAVYCSLSSNITFDDNSSVAFNNNKASIRGGAVFFRRSSHITFDDNSSVTFNNNEAKYGGAVYCVASSHITFDDNSSVAFNNNKASITGGAVHCRRSSHITFDDNSSVTFNDNKAKYGGAVYCLFSSHITFDGNSSVTFNNNKASDGAAVYCGSSTLITFDDNSSVTFNSNEANYNGEVVSSSSIKFDGNSIATFIIKPFQVKLDIHSEVNFNELIVTHGRSSIIASNIAIDGNSFISFIVCRIYMLTGEVAQPGSIPCILYNKQNYSNNISRSTEHGVFYLPPHTPLTGDSLTSVHDNLINSFESIADIISDVIVYWVNDTVSLSTILAFNYFSSIAIIGNGDATISCNNTGGLKFVNCDNVAIVDLKWERCGSMNETSKPGIMFCDSSNISIVSCSFHNSTGQALVLSNVSGNLLIDNSNFTYNNYFTGDGAAIHFTADTKTSTLFKIKNCNFSHNKGAKSVVYLDGSSTKQSNHIMVQNSVFINNRGVPVYILHANLHISGDILFKDNEAESGGGIYGKFSVVVYDDKCKAKFKGNSVKYYGGAIYLTHSSQSFEGNTTVSFIGNSAEKLGGAVYLFKNVTITFNSHTNVSFKNNTAMENGGALHFSNNITTVFHKYSYVGFYNNSANQYGGAVYGELLRSIILFDTTQIKFDSNTALTGPDVYIDVPGSCDKYCLNNRIVGVKKRTLSHTLLVDHIITPPIKLEFHLKCVYNQTNMSCNIYMMKNVMLGQELMIDACARDYYDHPADATQFVVSGGNNNHRINGSRVLVSCTVFQGISIIGAKINDKHNFSMTITSNHGSKSDFNATLVQLIAELSPCRPGFFYDKETCVCDNSDVVSCSGSTSSIKRGYWFGKVDDKATVSVCPNSYCNFSCCETANGFYKLSPDRANQCNSQRSGAACGSCKNGYSLSFDSIECVSIDKCTTGQTVLVVTLSMIYWIVIVILVFIMTYYHFGIGYLYAVTYYYSMVDILLSEQVYISQVLFTVVSIMSSIAKLTPQFLGQLCLVTNMSGIDQQFIHYVHPLAVAIILIAICLSTRISYKISSFVSRGIIHMICFLLLLSYTSVATTSLLLLRPLTFDNVDKVYTYLSPDMEYFHGRHLPYCFTAILCTLVIVIGLPLLLLLEPFLNSKINFTKIKPLLDQFQGCYKDKYRSFAAYYMICRMVNILIIIAIPSNNDTSHYLLIITNSTLALIHVSLQPYESSNLNLFDGFVLQLMIVVSMVPLIDTYNKDVLVAFMFILVILPLIAFLIMEIYLSKKGIKKITTYCVPPKPDTTNDNNEIPMTDFVDSVIDDSRRVKATVCTIEESKNEDATCYRDSFIEVMNEIED